VHGGGGRGEMPTSFTMGGGIVQAGEMSGVHVRGECVQGECPEPSTGRTVNLLLMMLITIAKFLYNCTLCIL